MTKNFKLIVVGAPKTAIEKKINDIYKPFISKLPQSGIIILRLDFSNLAGVKGHLEYDHHTDDFQSTYTGDNFENVGRHLILDLESKLNSWKKSAA